MGYIAHETKQDSAARLMAALQRAAPDGRTMLDLARDVGVAVGTISVLMSLLRRSGIEIRQRRPARTGAGSYGTARPSSATLLFWID